MQELWKNVIDFEELYQVSNFGNIRRHPDKQSKNKYRIPKPLERKTAINHLGYRYATLCKDGKSCKKTIHQLVAAAFIVGFKYGNMVNHINGIKLDNSLANLEISNSTHNNTHAHFLGLLPKPGKSIYRNVSIKIDNRHRNPKPTYHASVKINSKRHPIGYYKDEIEAAKAVDTFLDTIGDTQRKRNFP